MINRFNILRDSYRGSLKRLKLSQFLVAISFMVLAHLIKFYTKERLCNKEDLWFYILYLYHVLPLGIFFQSKHIYSDYNFGIATR